MNRRKGISPLLAGILTLVIVGTLTVIGFVKENPFRDRFTIGAVVTDAAGIKSGSVVRIAGVDVGKVTSIERWNGAEAARIDMEIQDNGQPIYSDATARVRPRLFLEGNFVVDIAPGTPGGERLDDGDVLPLAQTSRAVQFDELLSTLQGPQRRDLQVVIQAIGTALSSEGAQDEDPLVRGETTGESLNDTVKALAAGSPDIRRVARALQGQDRGDLRNAVVALARAAQPLGENAQELGQLLDGLERTVSVFAEESTAVRDGIGELPRTVQIAQERLPQIRAALPPIRGFSSNVADSLDRVPGLVRSSGPFLSQTNAFLSSEDEARGLVRDLEPVSRSLASSAPDLANLLGDLDRIAVCARDVLIPTANQVIDDGPYTTGISSWGEILRGFTGLASGLQNFDGNGPYGRVAAVQGSSFGTGRSARAAGGETASYVGTANLPLTSTRPALPSSQVLSSTAAPWRFDVACRAAARPNLSAVPVGRADGTTP